jgi:hypothetical protein
MVRFDEEEPNFEGSRASSYDRTIDPFVFSFMGQMKNIIFSAGWCLVVNNTLKMNAEI